jgi:cyclopropane-fatty-acyl-phospholipid synthase
MAAPAVANPAQNLLARAGIAVNGPGEADITVHNSAFYARVARDGSLGLGESYMDGWWDCPRLDELFRRLFAAGLDRSAPQGWRSLALRATSAVLNSQTRRRSRQVARRHYDAGNELFQAMLGPTMVYTSGLWDNAADLEAAQQAKLDAVCRALDLSPGMRVLDIGCGFGGFARFAAARYHARVEGITLSRQQLALGRELCAGLPVELRLEDYREHASAGPGFDRIVSLGMFEHVGYRNHRRFFLQARRLLAPGGRMFLSTIGANRTVRSTDPWIERYIFPNSHLPSIRQLGAALEDVFAPHLWLNWAGHYDRTLMAWFANFEVEWERWRRQYGDAFCRMWQYYLLSCAGAFRARHLQDWQLVLDPL